MIEHAYIGFGTNLGDRWENYNKAVDLLTRQFALLRIARVVESKPVDGVAGGNFLNTVLECRRIENCFMFLRQLQAIELSVGGTTDKHGNARTCDLDILLWGNEIIDTPDLHVPHPRMHLRDFYLIPLCELIPDSVHPVSGKTFKQLLDEIRLISVIGPATQ